MLDFLIDFQHSDLGVGDFTPPINVMLVRALQGGRVSLEITSILGEARYSCDYSSESNHRSCRDHRASTSIRRSVLQRFQMQRSTNRIIASSCAWRPSILPQVPQLIMMIEGLLLALVMHQIALVGLRPRTRATPTTSIRTSPFRRIGWHTPPALIALIRQPRTGRLTMQQRGPKPQHHLRCHDINFPDLVPQRLACRETGCNKVNAGLNDSVD